MGLGAVAATKAPQAHALGFVQSAQLLRTFRLGKARVPDAASPLRAGGA